MSTNNIQSANNVYQLLTSNKKADNNQKPQAGVPAQLPNNETSSNEKYSDFVQHIINKQINASKSNTSGNNSYINKLLNKHISKTAKVSDLNQALNVNYKNDLRKLFNQNNAVIYALVIRNFNAKDKDGDGLINKENKETSGNFLNAIERLDELKGLGVNTLHMLPVHPPGKKEAMGNAGSIYAPADFLTIDPKLADPNSPLTPKEQMKEFIKECHKRDIKVMLDLPSCSSVDFYEKHPELMSIDEQGRPKVPQGWQDIRMFKPWEDEDKKVLNKDLVDMHKKYVDMCLDLGVDGIRADVARAKPVEFWNEIIPYSRSKDPNFAWLAESYTYEDESPILNLPKDRPEDLLGPSGFDSYYGQYHIFSEWKNAGEFHKNMVDNLKMTQELPPNKSLIGSFMTHDDISPMAHGGVPYCNLISGLQTTLPMTNPYMLSGFETGDRYVYPYKNKYLPKSDTDCHVATAHSEKLDIFNYSAKPHGNNPEVGEFFSKMSDIRKKYNDVITKGSYIPLSVKGNKEDQIIAYARHHNGKTLLVVANKDVNAKEKGQIQIPGLKSSQVLKEISPQTSVDSRMKVKRDGALNVDLAPAGFHIFEIDTPEIEKLSPEVYKQKLSL